MNVFPLFDQDDKYMSILTGKEHGSTKYLSQFDGLHSFDAISCQFAMHYACETEEVFRAFAKNLQKYGKDTFFGTCSDGQSIYSLLVGKKAHLFGRDKRMAGEYAKLYEDRDSWPEEFGMPVRVSLESFDKPAVEYLVPFEKVTRILDEHGWDLVETKLFKEWYSSQTRTTLTVEEQEFSFLNRSFLFRRSKTKKEAPAEAVAEAVAEAPKKRKLIVKDEPVPILFHGADESKGDHRYLSVMSSHPIDVDSVSFPTVEHYFQAMKAKEFKDDEIYKKILTAKTPKAAKAMGDKIKNVVTEVWDAKKDAVMYTGLRAKFVQHPELRKQLLETGDLPIGDANARDTYWGIGTAETSEKSKHPSKWRGKNKLGVMLMDLRTEFRAES